MAPEQFLGADAHAGSDQFGFFLTFYELLYGMTPFSASTLQALKTNVARGITSLPTRPRISASLKRAILRGLSVNPEHRYGTMGEVVAILAPPARTSRRGLVLAGLAVCGMLAFFAWQRSIRHRDSVSCVADESILTNFSPSIQARVQTAFYSTGAPFASDAFVRLRSQIQERDQRWNEAYTQACKATRVQGGQSERRMQERLRCLEGRRRETEVLIALLQEADVAMVSNASEAIASLRAIGDCAFAAWPVEAAATTKEYEKARERLEQAIVANAVGRDREAIMHAEAAVAQATPLAAPWLLARALTALAAAQEAINQRQEALATIKRATPIVSQLGDADLEAKLWLHRAATLAKEAAHAEAEVALDAAAAAVVRAGKPVRLQWELERGRGVAAIYRRDDLVARDALSSALAMAREGLHPVDVATTQVSLGVALKNLTQYDAAFKVYGEALRGMRKEYGSVHPRVASLLQNLGNLQRKTGDLAGAQKYYEQVLAIHKSLGTDAWTVGGALYALGTIQSSRGAFVDARSTLLRSLELRESSAPEHPDIARTLVALSRLARLRGDLDDAKALAGRALELKERVFGDKHLSLAYELIELGYVYARAGDARAGRDYLVRALEIRTAALGEKHLKTAYVLMSLGAFALEERAYASAERYCQQALAIEIMQSVNDGAPETRTCLGEARLGLGKPRLAAQALAEARSAFDRNGSDAYLRARVRYLLARALHTRGDARWRALRREALELLTSAPDSSSQELRAALRAWRPGR